LYCINVNSKSFTIFSRLYVSVNFQIISKKEKFGMINFSRKIVDKNVKQKRSKCGALRYSRQYGEGRRKLSKKRTKEDVFDK
jgi:hypothetical protein